MKKIVIGLIAAVFGSLPSYPQSLAQLPSKPQPIEFERRLGESGAAVGNSVIELAAGGFVVAGYGKSAETGSLDAWLLRFDAAGNTIWTRKYGSAGKDYAWDVREAKDGGFYVVGFSDSKEPGNEDVWLFRTDRSGTLLWERRFGGKGEEEAWALELLENGDVIVLAQTASSGKGKEDAWLLRVTPQGETVWTRTMGGPDTDRAFALARSAKGFVAAGMSRETAGADLDVWAFEFSADGETLWEQRYKGPADDIGHGILSLGADGFLLTGYGRSFGAKNNDAYLMRIGLKGELIWRRVIGEQYDDRAMMSDRWGRDGYISIGYTLTAGQDWNVLILGSAADGTPLWQWVLERPGPDRGVMIRPTRDGGYVLTGTFGYSNAEKADLFLMKLRPPERKG